MSSTFKELMFRCKNTFLHPIFALSLFFFAVLLSQCTKDDGGIGPDGSPSSIIFPTDSVSYSLHVQPLFNQACALSGCHSAGEGPDELRLDSYDNLIFGARGIRVVIPGNAGQSTLVFRIQGTVGPRMPPNGNPLNQNQINGIRAWINEGARRN